MAYFSVFGISNFANGSNGDQVSFIDENGKVKTTNYNIPGQKFVKTGKQTCCDFAIVTFTRYDVLATTIFLQHVFVAANVNKTVVLNLQIFITFNYLLHKTRCLKQKKENCIQKLLVSLLFTLYSI